jgi:hypothetical protein
MDICQFEGLRESFTVENYDVHPITSERATIQRVNVGANVSTNQWRLEITKVTATAAVCIPTQPTSYFHSDDLHRLREWWQQYRYNIAMHFSPIGRASSLFLVLSKKTTPQYGNCCVTNDVNSTILEITAPIISPETLSFSAGGQISEATRTFGFSFGRYEEDHPPWVIFITREKVRMWGPFKKLSRQLENLF